MKLTLHSFGIYKSKTFDFLDSGLTLISGPSGKGKTTIFRAIHYALTGEGSKLPTHGETACKVVLEYEDMIITRTNRPAKLQIKCGNKTLDNAEAQNFLQNRMSQHLEVGYLAQKGENSFLGMSPAEKLRFLERIVFGDLDIEEVKEKARKKVSDAELELARLQGEKSGLADVDHPGEMKRSEREIEDEIKKISSKIRSLKESIEKKEKSFREAIATNARIEYLAKEISMLNFLDEPDQPGETKTLLAELDMAKQSELYTTTINSLQPHLSHQQQLEEEIKNINVPMFCAQKLEYMMQVVSSTEANNTRKAKERLLDPERLDELIVQLPIAEKDAFDYAQSSLIRACPKCQTSLRIISNHLEMCAISSYNPAVAKAKKAGVDAMKKEHQDLLFLKKSIALLPKLIEVEEIDLDEWKKNIALLTIEKKKYDDTIKKVDGLSKKLSAARDNPAFTKLQALLKKIEGFASNAPGRKVKDIEAEIVTLTQLKKEYQRIVSHNKGIGILKDARIADLKKLSFCDLPSFDTEITEIKALVRGAEERKIELEIELSATLLHLKKLGDYTEWKEKKTRLDSGYTLQEKKFTLAKKFRNTIITAEMLTISNLIDEINTHLSIYLNVFFPDDPLTIELCLFKANLKTKVIRNQINLTMGFRGDIADMSTLSGGEKDRVTLAFTLAFSDIFGMPILMIDETLSSLDAQTIGNILEYISEQNKSKSIFIIAHQISNGHFSTVIEV